MPKNSKMSEELLRKDQLHPYQRHCVEGVVQNPFFALLLEMGLGKTVSALTAINELAFELLEIETTLVVAPKRVVETVWHVEGAKWEHLQHLRFSRIIGTEKQRKAALKVDADVYLVSRDNIAWLCGLYGGSSLPFDMIVLDESSSFKNHTSVRFQALKLVRPSLQRVLLLTGTPAPNGLLDLWAQMYLLDMGERLETHISYYRKKYFSHDSYSGYDRYTLNPGAEEMIHEKISDIAISMKAKDYLDLPGRVDNIISIVLPPSIQAKYDEFEKEKVLDMTESGEITEEGVISAVNAAALTNKLLQFANGAVYLPEKEADEEEAVKSERDFFEVHKLKIEALKDIIEDSGGSPVLVAWSFRSDMFRIKKALKKYKPVQLSCEQDVYDWNAGKIRLLLMHPASGGHGLNLQAGGHNIVWFGQTWSLELFLQLNARLDRQGQKNKVIINRLVAVDTIETRVVGSLMRKEEGQDTLMAAVKATVRKHTS